MVDKIILSERDRLALIDNLQTGQTSTAQFDRALTDLQRRIEESKASDDSHPVDPGEAVRAFAMAVEEAMRPVDMQLTSTDPEC